MVCEICKTRRARRFCPAIRAEICPICCGTYREETLNCPLDCQYLQEARKHEKIPDIDPAQFPNPDIRISDRFIRDNEALLLFLGRTVMETALQTPGAVDRDVREALAALIRTHRTLDSGLYYETRPENPIAAEIGRRIQTAVAEFRRAETEQLHMTRTRDADVLGLLAFFERLEINRNNGRKRGRAFIDFLRRQFPEKSAGAAPAAPSLIVSG